MSHDLPLADTPSTDLNAATQQPRHAQDSESRRHRPPASAYHHALLIEQPTRQLHMAGQLGERADGSISDDFREQARQAWINIKAILAEGGMSVADIVKVTSYIVGRKHIRAYVDVHRAEMGEHQPPWTLLLVAGLGSPKYLVEVEATAIQ